ncbi:MAG: tRNA pseudouridine synthase A [Candidatus Binatia bacterium]|nr:MAG: tRNA pseudouridine synthase A [Candidatus Binatia bacterium]
MLFRLTLAYDGTAYRGWQVQPEGPTIQAVLEEALERLCGERVRLRVAGRTDAGVHAAAQVAAFRCPKGWEPEILRRALDALTPPDIVVRRVSTAPEDFDPRKDALSRVYLYRIWNAPVPNVFLRRFAWHVREPLDTEAMGRAAEHLLGEHDFSSFRAAGCTARHAVRRVLRSSVERKGSQVVYTIEATGFVRHMVRNVVGALVEVGSGRKEPAWIAAVLRARDRTRAARTAPAHGLCLWEVRYPSEAQDDPETEAVVESLVGHASEPDGTEGE